MTYCEFWLLVLRLCQRKIELSMYWRTRSSAFRGYLMLCILVWILGFALDLYYLIMNDIITSVAHVLAVLMGLLTGILAKYISGKCSKKLTPEQEQLFSEEKVSK